MNKDFLAEIEKLQNKNKKKSAKKINSKQKGNRGESEFVKLLNERFKPLYFKRSPGSGALVGGQNYLKNIGLEKHVIDALSSDIIVPTPFVFQLEHKSYKKESLLMSHLLRYKKEDNISKWWEEVTIDASKTDKEPMIIVKLDRAERFCVIRYDYIKSYFGDEINLFNYIILKRENEELFFIELESLFKLNDDFWIKK